MNNYGRGVVFGGLILASLLVLFFVGLNFVKATDVISSVTVTATGDPFGLDNWTVSGVNETINFTITFTSVGNGQDEANVTNITIIFNSFSLFDSDILPINTTNPTDNGTSTSADGLIWDCISLHDLADTADLNPAATRDGIQCLNNTASGGINISAPAANNFINIFFNVTHNITEKEQAVIWTVETQDQNGAINSTQVSTNVDSLAPRFVEINITDGNTSLSNGTAYYRINDTNILNGEQALTVELTIEDANTNLGAQKPYAVELFYFTNGSTDANETATPSSGALAPTRVNLTTTSSNSPYFYTGSISQADARAAIGPGAAGGHPNSTIISFVFFANDTQDNEIQINMTDEGATHSFLTNVSSDTPVLHEINVNDTSDNKLIDLDDRGTEWLKADYGHSVTFEVGGAPLDLVSTGAVGIRAVTVAYNSTGALIVGTNGYVAGFEGFLNTANNLSVVSTTNTSVLYNMSLDLTGNNSNTVYFAIILNSTNGNYVSTFVRNYRVDSSPPAEPTFTVPTDRSIDVSKSITYKCSADDSGSGQVTYEWTLTKPSKATVTKTGAEVTWTSTDTNEAGSYNVECKATDKVGNSISHKSTSTETFTAFYTTVSGEGAVGGEAGVGVTFDVDFSVVSEASITGSEGRIRSFSFDGQTSHTITIKEVTESSATVEIASDPITLALLVGETKEADVNADGSNDMSVTLNNVKNGVADLTIKKLEEGAKVVAGEEAEEIAREEAARREAAAEEVREAGGGLAWLWIVIILAVIIVIGYFVVRRK